MSFANDASSDPSAEQIQLHGSTWHASEDGPGVVQHIKAGKVDVATIHDVDGSARQEHIGHERVQLAIRLCSECCPAGRAACAIFTAALVVRLVAHGKTDRHRAMVSSPGRRRYQVQLPVLRDVQRPRLRGDEPLGQPHGYASRAFRWHGQKSSAEPAGPVIFDAWTDRQVAGHVRSFPGRCWAKAMDRYCSAQENVRTR